MQHLRRPKPLGIDPRLVLVFELGAVVDPEEWRRAGLRVLDGSDRQVVIAFADDPAMMAFHERLDALRAGAPEGQRSEPYAAFFDAIDDLRPLAAEDRLTADVVRAIAASAPGDSLRLDIECWHPGERVLAREWLLDLTRAVEQAAGSVVDEMVHDGAGLLLARAYVPAGRVAEVAELDVIARIDVLPIPGLTVPQFYGASVADLPRVDAPDPRTPIVGLVDSGVQSAHPLIAPAVLAAESLSASITENQDEHGHGTMVAALLLHGSVDQAIGRSLPLRPACKLVSVRVLNADNEFPADELWENDLVDAVEWCADQGARIVNLSIGDDRRPLTGPRQLSAAALIDTLIRERDLVVVVSSGNARPSDYLERIDEAAAVTYPASHLADEETAIIDPGSAMLALTVGGITTAAAASGLSGRETVARVPMGRPGWPSPITRRGPGLNGSVKPELVERAGTLGVETSRLVNNDAELGIVSAGIGPDRLLAVSLGTSFAAPLVTRVAAAVVGRFPEFSCNLVRALVLLSAVPPSFGDELETERPSDRAEAVRNLLGFGRPEIGRAIESTSHRAVLVAEGSTPVDGVHIYEIPLPSSFFDSGGERGVDVALAFDPPTRARRLDYLASTMAFYLVRGMSVEEVAEVFSRLESEDEVTLDESAVPVQDADSEDPGDEEQAASISGPPTVSQLKSKIVKLVPTSTVRSRGANQVGRCVFRQRLNPDRHHPAFLVLRNVNHWDDDGSEQRYGLAVALWRSTAHADLFAELEARLEAVIEVPVEIQLEA